MKVTWRTEVPPNHLQTVLGLLLFLALLGTVIYYDLTHGGTSPGPARAASPAASPTAAASASPPSVRR